MPLNDKEGSIKELQKTWNMICSFWLRDSSWIEAYGYTSDHYEMRSFSLREL
jgi:hypothetical protein